MATKVGGCGYVAPSAAGGGASKVVHVAGGGGAPKVAGGGGVAAPPAAGGGTSKVARVAGGGVVVPSAARVVGSCGAPSVVGCARPVCTASTPVNLTTVGGGGVDVKSASSLSQWLGVVLSVVPEVVFRICSGTACDPPPGGLPD
ncbi:circumsporozoite protein-like [Bacillus rossius redtenbacheri]|uniref:circumsporozoite protein-like n=1 Tax=Bacillus rossius redtenbacheri TaxID=93214 RepID=UPI002FDCE631